MPEQTSQENLRGSGETRKTRGTFLDRYANNQTRITALERTIVSMKAHFERLEARLTWAEARLKALER